MGVNIITTDNIDAKLADFKAKKSFLISSLMKSLGLKTRKSFIEYLNRDDEIGDKLKDVYLDIVEFWEKSLLDKNIHGHNVMFYLKSAIRSLGFNYARENDGNWTDKSRIDESPTSTNKHKIIFEIVEKDATK